MKLVLPMMMIAALATGAYANVSSTYSSASHGEMSSTRNVAGHAPSASTGGSAMFLEGIASHSSNAAPDRALSNSAGTPRQASTDTRGGMPSATHSTEGAASHLR